MVRAYGNIFLYSDGGDHSSLLCQQWDAVVRLAGKHYHLPGGSVGRVLLICLMN